MIVIFRFKFKTISNGYVSFLILYTIRGCPKGHSPVNDPVQNEKLFLKSFFPEIAEERVTIIPLLLSALTVVCVKSAKSEN